MSGGSAAPVAHPHDAPAPDGASLVDKIPLSAAVVLLLGCGDGTIGAAFRRRNPRSRVIGIEANPHLAHRASTVLDEVYCLAPEPGPLPPLPPADCILLDARLVAALGRPADLLAELARLLAPGGLVVFCAPAGPVEAQHQLLLDAGLHALDGEEMPLPSAPDGPATQIVWRAATGAIPPLRVFSTMLPPVGGVSQVRVVEPLRALAGEPAIATAIIHRPEDVPDTQGSPGIFILHRPALLGADGLATVRYLIARSWLVVCEFDDHPSQIAILHRSDVHNFDAVHAIQTSTPTLAEVLARENPEVAVFPNALHHLPEPANFTDPDRITMLFAALNREDDWPGHMDALNTAAAKAGDALHFQVIADQAFFDALETPHKTFTPLCDYPTYLEILSRCEVSFMPLRDTLFNRCKSDLKFLEAAAHRAVSLASPTVYAGSIRDGENGLIFTSPHELHDRLMRLATRRDATRAMAETARRDVAGHRMLAYQMHARTQWYRALWSRRETLHAALLARVPSLAG